MSRRGSRTYVCSVLLLLLFFYNLRIRGRRGRYTDGRRHPYIQILIPHGIYYYYIVHIISYIIYLYIYYYVIIYSSTRTRTLSIVLFRTRRRRDERIPRCNTSPAIIFAESCLLIFAIFFYFRFIFFTHAARRSRFVRVCVKRLRKRDGRAGCCVVR